MHLHSIPLLVHEISLLIKSSYSKYTLILPHFIHEFYYYMVCILYLSIGSLHELLNMPHISLQLQSYFCFLVRFLKCCPIFSILFTLHTHCRFCSHYIQELSVESPGTYMSLNLVDVSFFSMFSRQYLILSGDTKIENL